MDVGLKTFATLSNGETIKNPRHLKLASGKLRKLQRQLSKKKKGSANRKKAIRKVALAHEGVANARKDFHHKTALDLVRRFDRIAVEKLNIKGLVKNHKLAQAISDVAWGEFNVILGSKAENAGKQRVEVIPNNTSTDCCVCGYRQKMPLKIRIFDCEKCSNKIDRDKNAAINIENRAELAPIDACGVRRRTSKQERERAKAGAASRVFTHAKLRSQKACGTDTGTNEDADGLDKG